MKEKLDFYKGADISFLPQCMDAGMQVKDFDGSVMEPIALLQKYGVNAIRLRIWHTPGNVPESGGYCDLEHTVALAKKICAHGMRFMLDFHYSDFWADPGQQRKPKDWEKLSGRELEEAVFSYTRDVLLTLQAEGVLPDIVQIGNEIRSGLLFPEGELPNYAGMTRLVNAGIAGARSVADSSQMQVMIHLDQGGRYFYLKEWFSNAFANGLDDFDLIGLSYYPFWHGTYTDLKETMTQLLQEYRKPIMIVESAYAWRKCRNGFIDEAQEKIAGFPASPEGQRRVLELVNGIVASLPDQMGMGVFYWEPVCIPVNGVGAWAENMGVLDENGQVLDGIRAFSFTRAGYDPTAWVKVYEPKELTVLKGAPVTLPEEAAVLLADGSLIRKKVCWEEGEKAFVQPGSYRLHGVVEDLDAVSLRRLPVSVTVQVMEHSVQRENLLQDVNWDEGMAWWDTQGDMESVVFQVYPDFIDPYPAPPVNALRVEGARNFRFRISQEVRITEAGYYCFEAQIQGTDTTGVQVTLFVESRHEKEEQLIHLTEHEFADCRMEKVWLESGTVSVGVSIMASPMYMMLRRLAFFRVE